MWYTNVVGTGSNAVVSSALQTRIVLSPPRLQILNSERDWNGASRLPLYPSFLHSPGLEPIVETAVVPACMEKRMRLCGDGIRVAQQKRFIECQWRGVTEVRIFDPNHTLQGAAPDTRTCRFVLADLQTGGPADYHGGHPMPLPARIDPEAEELEELDEALDDLPDGAFEAMQ
ncbi:hypothetical protein RIF29_20912 [Crotalaria pallida]|uniref:Uncharacterized protein n=1 Tax=Crotalaria pallida TaxID=3830 RepID=A0AAN9F1Z4_CROPI